MGKRPLLATGAVEPWLRKIGRCVQAPGSRDHLGGAGPGLDHERRPFRCPVTTTLKYPKSSAMTLACFERSVCQLTQHHAASAVRFPTPARLSSHETRNPQLRELASFVNPTVPKGGRRTEGGLGALHIELQEVGGARDARVIVADRLLALPLQFVIGEVEVPGYKTVQVFLDRALILRRGRNDARV